MIRSLLLACLAFVASPVLAAHAPAPAKIQAPTPLAAAATTAPAPDAQQAAVNTAVENAALKQENARLQEQIDRVTMEAKNAPVIDRENQQLRERIITLEADKGRLTHETQSLSNWRDGLKTGAVIFFFGLVVGVLLGRIRRRAGWSDI